jgi:TBC1 domain family protein 5
MTHTLAHSLTHSHPYATEAEEAVEPPVPKTKAELWSAVFERPDYYQTLRSEALAGRNRGAAFRGVCWRLFLDVLPENRDEWRAVTDKARAEYQLCLDTLFVDPTKAENIDLALNNPLSQEDDSPWQKYFQDSELKDEIRRDVSRTYPEVEYFQHERTQNIMLNILFVFAKKNPDVSPAEGEGERERRGRETHKLTGTHVPLPHQISYRQGMHELLAPVVFVMDEERLGDAESDTSEDMQALLEGRYMEHDAYAVFCKIMEVTKTWFVSQQERKLSADSKAKQPLVGKNGEALLFRAPQQEREDPDSVIQHKLHRIHSVILKQFDEEVCPHCTGARAHTHTRSHTHTYIYLIAVSPHASA